MIKFFRHIRQSLIKDNKMGKYFKYAIGEILLVMVGILLALQVNNWNERKKNEATLTQFLMDFKEELSLNIRDFKNEVKRIDKQIAQKNTILLNTRLDTISIDTLENHITTRYIQVSYNSSVLKRFENAQIENHGKYDSIFGDLQEIFGFTWSTLDISKKVKFFKNKLRVSWCQKSENMKNVSTSWFKNQDVTTNLAHYKHYMLQFHFL